MFAFLGCLLGIDGVLGNLQFGGDGFDVVAYFDLRAPVLLRGDGQPGGVLICQALLEGVLHWGLRGSWP